MLKQKTITMKFSNNTKISTIVFVNKFDDILNCFNKNNLIKKIFIITDSNVSKLYLKEILKKFKQNNYEVFSYIFQAGEKQKNLNTLSKIYDYALSCGIDRHYNVIALGGGVVGDISGLFASTYMRGLNFIQIPTTLLAMVDSSIGGKTAVNTTFGKNIIGTFYQPQYIFINSIYLKTLDIKQLKNGLGEVIKYAISFDKQFFNKLLTLSKYTEIDIKEFNEIIYKCCKFKTNIVLKDEKETKGLRQLLNFGHTFAHALETITNYKKFLHGEAVVIGILFAIKLAINIKLCDIVVETKIKELLDNFKFNIKLNMKYDSKKFLNLMKKDKKSISSKIKFVVPTKIGNVVSNIEIDDIIILKTIKEFIK